ncbi:MAG: Uma2 family endonuclease [Gemmatimonadaceae bacterium]|nr:Uma2 family endonuclease [Gloeobacterales cyanobacterium ES-bin-141]
MGTTLGRALMATPVVTTDTWVRADWDSFVHLADAPAYERAKFYYNRGWMRIEMSPVGPAHARDNNLLSQIVGVFALSRDLRLEGYITPSLRKAGLQEAQPDLAFYVGDGNRPVRGTKPIDIPTTDPPSLVIEVSATTLDDDLTTKRKLYTELGVGEYWVVDVLAGKVKIFGRAGVTELMPLEVSSVFAGLAREHLEEALRLGQGEGDTAAMRYILNLPRNTDG